MKILWIKAKDVMACPGSWAQVAEAAVVDADDSITYVTVQEFDTLEMTACKQSLYGFLAEDGPAPTAEVFEEHTTVKSGKESVYAPVFDKLRKVIKMLG